MYDNKNTPHRGHIKHPILFDHDASTMILQCQTDPLCSTKFRSTSLELAKRSSRADHRSIEGRWGRVNSDGVGTTG